MGAVAGSFRVYDLIYGHCVEIKINDLNKQIFLAFSVSCFSIKTVYIGVVFVCGMLARIAGLG